MQHRSAGHHFNAALLPNRALPAILASVDEAEHCRALSLAMDEARIVAFELAPRLIADTVTVADWTLSRVLLVDDRRFPWLILVPRREGLRELHDLDATDRARVIEEIARASTAPNRAFAPDKINVGVLGNLVPQLHIHVVARRRDDPAWPGPVWGVGERLAYRAAERVAQLDAVRTALRDERDPHP